MQENWLDSFDRYFEIMPANTPFLVEQAMALRYQVYCIEHSFENADSFSDGLERDRFDRRSVHSLIRRLTSESSFATVATVRLVLADGENPQDIFPIEAYCPLPPDIQSDIALDFERKQIAEISRFAVSKEFRRRSGEAKTVHGIVNGTNTFDSPDERRLIPHISLGLFQAIVRMSAENNIKLWYAVMETQLLRLLRRFGIRFTPIGEPVHYHGLRVPCIGPVDEVMSAIKRDCPAVWAFITQRGRLWPY